MGIAIYFNVMHLDLTQVLRPEWVTNGVYRILTHPELARARGLVATDQKTLARLLEIPVHEDQKEGQNYYYPREHHGYLIELMKQFELCYRLESGEILFPDLQDKSQPSIDFDYATATKFRCSYGDFLPPTVMPRFMVKQHKDIEGELRWRTGMVIKSKLGDARGLVKADDHRKQLLIWIQGKSRREYLASLRETLAGIHDDFPTLTVTQEIGCPCDKCLNQKEPFFFEYDMVLGFFLRGDIHLPCHKSMKMIPLTQILDGIGHGLAKTLEEIRDDVKEFKHKNDFEGSSWDKFTEIVSCKLGIGPLKVDLFKLLKLLS